MQEREAYQLAEKLLLERLGEHAGLVTQYLKKPERQNLMSIENTAEASIRYGVSPAATAAIASGFLQDLIQAGIISKDHAYLACDPFKVSRARQNLMKNAKIKYADKLSNSSIIGISFDSRKDLTRTLVLA